MTNEFGLDESYFRLKLKQIVRDLKYYRPDEMERALQRLAATAAAQGEANG